MAGLRAKANADLLISELADDNMQIHLHDAMPDKWGQEKKSRMLGAIAYRSASWKQSISWFTKGYSIVFYYIILYHIILYCIIL